VRERVVLREPDRLAELRDRVRAAAGLELLDADAYCEGRRLRVRLEAVEPLRLLARGPRRFRVTFLLERLREAQVRLRHRRLVLQGGPELRDRLIDVPRLLQQDAEHVAGLGVVRLARERFAEQRDRLVRPAGLP
jgi:hypothetical protein